MRRLEGLAVSLTPARVWLAPPQLVSTVTPPTLSALLAAELILLAALAVAIWSTARTVRAGRGPEGAGSILPVGLGLWALGHVVEAATMAAHPRPFAFGPSDIAFVIVSVALGAASLRVLRRSAIYGDWTATLRTGLDAGLIALASSSATGSGS